MNKFINNNKGSTLLMVLIITAVLTVLGTALISMSMMSVNMKYNDTREKKAFYYAESGLDELYAYVGHKVEETLIGDGSEGNIGVFLETKNYIDDLYRRIQEELNNDPEDKIYSSYYSDDGIDDNAIEREANNYFNTQFKNRFNSIVNLDTFNVSDSNIVSTINIEETFDNGSDTNLYVIDYTSTYDNSSELKTIQAKVNIKAPEELSPLKVEDVSYSVEVNPVLGFLLASYRNIKFNNSNTTINGKLYSFGLANSILQANSTVSVNDYGIELFGDNRNVTINGDVVTNGYFEIDGDGSALTVNNGRVYCNSMVINKYSDASVINLNSSNLYTYDDLELNGINSSIDINGSYYGLSNGAGSLGHNESSSININTQLGVDTSSLKISGSDPFTDGEDNTGIFIAGTNYLNLIDIDGNPWAYQVAESVAIKPNYRAYKHAFFDADDIDFFPDYRVREDYLYDSIEFKKVNESNFYINDFIDQDKEPEFTYIDKMFYMYNYYDLFKDVNDARRLIVGTEDNLVLDNFRYSLGLKVIEEGANRVFKLPSESNIVGDSEFAILMDTINKDFIYYLNRLDQRNGSSTDGMDYNGNAIDYFIDLSRLTTTTVNEVYEVDSINNLSQKATEVVYVSRDSTTDVNIVGVGGSTRAGANNINLTANSGDRLQGIIITNSNIYVSGDVDFSGLMLTCDPNSIDYENTSNIIIENGTQTFRNNSEKTEDYLSILVRNNPSIRSIFLNNTGTKNITEKTILDMSDENNQSLRYRDLIYINNWKEIK